MDSSFNYYNIKEKILYNYKIYRGSRKKEIHSLVVKDRNQVLFMSRTRKSYRNSRYSTACAIHSKYFLHKLNQKQFNFVHLSLQ